MKKAFLIGVVLLLTVFLIAETVEIRITGWGGGEEETQLAREKIAAFEATHPNIKIVNEVYPDNYTQALLTSFAAGNPPDVFLLDASYMPTFTERGIAVNIAPYMRLLKVDLDEYYPNVLDVFSSDGKLYGLPKGFTPMVVYYNKKMLKEAGLEEPTDDWTWNDFLYMATKLTKDTDGDGKLEQFGAQISKYFYKMCPMIWSYGGEIVSPDYDRATGYLNSRETIEAVQFFTDLILKYGVSPDSSMIDALGGLGNMLYTNKIGFYISGHWSLFGMKKYIDEGTLDIGVVRLPRGPFIDHSRTVIYATAWAVTSKSRHPREGLELVRWLSSAEGQEYEVLKAKIELSGHIPTNEKLVSEDPYGLEKKFVDLIPTAEKPIGAVVKDWYKAEDIFTEAMDKILLLGTPVKEALDWAASEIDTKVFGK